MILLTDFLFDAEVVFSLEVTLADTRGDVSNSELMMTAVSAALVWDA